MRLVKGTNRYAVYSYILLLSIKIHKNVNNISYSHDKARTYGVQLSIKNG